MKYVCKICKHVIESDYLNASVMQDILNHDKTHMVKQDG